MRLDRLVPLPDTTLELVLDDETITCDIYVIEVRSHPPIADVTVFDPLPAILNNETTYRVVARRRSSA